jgi:hypothetical protein
MSCLSTPRGRGRRFDGGTHGMSAAFEMTGEQVDSAVDLPALAASRAPRARARDRFRGVLLGTEELVSLRVLGQ